MLSVYRVLEFSGFATAIAGSTLADLGADVVVVEPPEGSQDRRIGPYLADTEGADNSLLWLAYNRNKRSVSFDLKSAQGREIVQKLAAKADIIIDGTAPRQRKALGLDYKSLSAANPSIIHVSISPFGERGPYARYRASDLVLMALGGVMYITGDADRAPVRISVAQAELHSGMHAVMGALIALNYREESGEGQHIDVSGQEAVVRMLVGELPYWEFDRYITRRLGSNTKRGKILLAQVFPCKDGFVCFRITFGRQGRGMKPLLEWMESEGMLASLKEMGDPQQVDLLQVSETQARAWEADITRFFMTHTRAELYAGALKRRIYLMPSNTIKEAVEEEQFKAREFWSAVPHPGGKKITGPGIPYRFSGYTPKPPRRAPMLGEHNEEILGRELGFSSETLKKIQVGGGK